MSMSNTLTTAAHYGPCLARKGDYEIIDCQACGFAHSTPLPTEDTVEQIYTAEYYSAVKPEYIALVEKERTWHESVFNERLGVLEGAVQGRRLLEVGSGPGIFLQTAVSRGWTVQGFEPSREAWAYSTKVLHMPVENTFFTHEKTQNEPFDSAYLGLVLEHIPNPIQMLENVRRCLKPEGVICVAVPNDFSPLQRALHEQGFPEWWGAPPHHLNYFTHESLKRILERTGFAVISQTATFPLEIFSLLGMNYIGNDEVGRKCHQLRCDFEKTLDDVGLHQMRQEIYALCQKYGIGRECVAYARVNNIA